MSRQGHWKGSGGVWWEAAGRVHERWGSSKTATRAVATEAGGGQNMSALQRQKEQNVLLSHGGWERAWGAQEASETSGVNTCWNEGTPCVGKMREEPVSWGKPSVPGGRV